ncbi:MAG TPA: MFS transporter [Caulobacteraceae bacterium]|nr:MFS transporter [Caulobacteraceae bacterium]
MSVLAAACDRAGILACSGGQTARPRLLLAATILASSLAFIDGSVVNVGLPAVGRSLHVGGDALPWVVNAYLLPLSALLLFGGAAGDRFGRRRLLVIGIVVFGLASAACAAAQSLPALLLARGAQGAGAALLLPNSLAILGGAFSGEARGRAVGVWAAVGAMAGAIGPVLGGWLIDTTGWRAIFLINLPIAAGAILLSIAAVPETRDDARAPLDWLGAALATLGLGALAWGLTEGSGPGGWSLTPVALLGAGAGLLVAFGVVQHRKGEAAMMPLAMFASREFLGLTLLTLLDYGALGGLLVLIPYELIGAGGYGATAAGAALLPFPILMAVGAPFLGAVAGRIGARIPLAAGSLVIAAGLLLALRIGPDFDVWTNVLPALVVIAIGMSGVAAPLTTAVLSSVDARHTGSASGLNSAVARAGGLVATALLGGVLARRGAALTAGVHVAVLACAAACLAGAVLGFVLIRGRGPSGAPDARRPLAAAD